MTFTFRRSLRACLFDLDGVLTSTASVHAAAWRQLFDEALVALAERGAPGDLRPFDADADYLRFVDGRRRRDGVRCFLESRGVELPEDGPGDLTVSSLAARKNELFARQLDEQGVQVMTGAVDLVGALAASGIRTGVVSSSANARTVLDRAGILDMFDPVVDGVVAADEGIAGKPAPDMFLRAAALAGVAPGDTAVVEDAVSGVEAAVAGRFGLVIGIGVDEHAAALLAAGADVAVASLAEVTVEPPAEVRP